MSLDAQLPSHPGQQDYQPAPAPQQGTSGLAITGLILAFFIAPVGFILSLIAIFRTGKGRAKGRGLAIAGLIVSVLIIAGATTAIVLAANSTVVDPGCTDGKAAILSSSSNVDAASLQTTVDELNAAAGKAKHDNVRNATKALADDYAQLLKAVKTGEVPAGIQEKITADAETFDSLCSIG